MSNGLISLPPAPASPPASVVTSDGWYPDVDVNKLRDRMRVGSVVTDARLRGAIVGALITADRELAIWRVARVLAGNASLAAIPAFLVDGVSIRVAAWQRAIDNFVMADLVETHRDIGATADGALRGEEMALHADGYRRAATHAIRDVLAVPRTSVALL